MKHIAIYIWVLLISGCFLFDVEGLPDTDEPQDTGDTDACPNLALSAQSLKWTDVFHGTQSSQSIELTNACSGLVPLNVTLELSVVDVFVVDTTPAEIQPGSTYIVPVGFSPQEPGAYEAILTIRGSDGSKYSVSLTANSTLNPDWDGDGFESVDVGGTDCDDSDAFIFPGAPDACYDGIDRDCDGGEDDDCDRDGFIAIHAGGEDCADDNPDIYPGAPESRNGDDDDCDGVADEGLIEVGDVVFSEFMTNPKNTPDSRGEWFEVRNTTSTAIDLRGWTIHKDEQKFEVMSTVRIPPFAQRVLANSDNPGRNGGFTADYEFDGSTFQLSNTTSHTYSLQFDDEVITAIVLASSRNVEGISVGLDPRMRTGADALDWTRWCLSQSVLPSGDIGSPGVANRLCPGLDDFDMDGYTVAAGDCDDADPLVHPGAAEVWGDWTDNDCSGVSDVATITSLVSTSLSGGTTNANPHNWGFLGQMGVGDIDDDGIDEWVVGGVNAYDYVGGVSWVSSSEYASFTGAASDVEEGRVEGFGEKHAFGVIGPKFADNSGDGISDLVIGGHDYYEKTTNVALALFEGGAEMDSALEATDATVAWTGSQSSNRAVVVSHGDWDGDGTAEILYGEPRTYFGSGGNNYRGRVVWLDADGLTGISKLSDGPAEWSGAVDSDGLGASIAVHDLDDDGYDDAVVAAPGRDDEQVNGGAVYLMYGQSTSGPKTATLDSAFDTKITGHLKGARLGEGVEPMMGDIDGDGAVDMVVSAYAIETVYVFFDVSSLTGTVSTSSADAEIESTSAPTSFGLGLAVGDANGDGFDEIVVGAPDDDTSDPASFATTAGALYVYSGASFFAGSVTQNDASARINAAKISDGFGQSLIGVDPDGDGMMNLLINEPGASSKQGAIRYWELW